MSKKYAHPIPDYTANLQRQSPLDVSEREILRILNKRKGRAFTATEILVVLGENINIWDNHAAVIFSAVRLEEREKVESDWVKVGSNRFPAWLVPKPKDEDE